MLKGLRTTLFCGLLVCIVETGVTKTPQEHPSSNCWLDAGQHHGIDPWLLFAIASEESDLDPSAVNVNNDGSEDLGLMQINSVWMPTLINLGYTRESLFDACVSITIGAWVLAESRAVFGRSWRAIGAYNAGTANTLKAERRRFDYAVRVLDRYHRLRQ